MMRTDSRFDDLTPQISETGESPLLILGHEIGIAHHVSGKDCSETSLRRLIGRAAHDLSRTSTPILMGYFREVLPGNNRQQPAFLQSFHDKSLRLIWLRSKTA
jgi:hypothetical protein